MKLPIGPTKVNNHFGGGNFKFPRKIAPAKKLVFLLKLKCKIFKSNFRKVLKEDFDHAIGVHTGPIPG